jgi:cell division protein ZipA
MDLRWGLLLVGLAVLALVYRYSRHRAGSDDGRVPDRYRKDPLISGVGKVPGDIGPSGDSGVESEDIVDDPLFDLGRTPADEFTATEAVEKTQPEPALNPEASKIVAIRLMSTRHGGFPADKLILALREQGLRHGQFGIFHRPDAVDDSRNDFSIANLIEPGSFDLTRIKKDYYPGVSVFLMLPGPDNGVGAFDDMVKTSRALADKLDGELVDEQGSKLSIQRERYLREEVVQYQHRLK